MAGSSSPYTVSNCCYGYLGTQCLHDISVTVEAGKFYGLIGPNGSGKTTFIHLLAGLSAVESGEIHLFGEPLHAHSKSQLARHISLVPQTFSLEFDYTVFDVVMMGRHPYIPRFSHPSPGDREAVEHALKTLDIDHLKERYITRLSGGERQRVMVARSLAQQTDILLLDEATANLDIKHSIEIMKSLKTIVGERGATIISAIHDLDLAAAYCDELLILDKGTLLASGRVSETLTADMLKNTFGVDAEVLVTEGHHHIRYRYSGHA